MKNKFLASIADMLFICVFFIGIISFFCFQCKIGFYALCLFYLIGYHFWILRDISLKARFQVYIPSYKMWREIGGSQSLKEEFSILEKKWLYIFPKKQQIVQKEKIDIGHFILSSREHSCMTQKHLADASGLSVRTIQRAESSGKIGYESLRCICAALNIDAPQISQDEIEPISLFISIGSVLEWGILFIGLLEWGLLNMGFLNIVLIFIFFRPIAKSNIKIKALFSSIILIPSFCFFIYLDSKISLLDKNSMVDNQMITIYQIEQYYILLIIACVLVTIFIDVFLRDYKSRKVFLLSVCVTILLLMPLYRIAMIKNTLTIHEETLTSNIMPSIKNMNNIMQILDTTDIPEEKRLCIREISLASVGLDELHTQYLNKHDYKLMYNDFENDIFKMQQRYKIIYKNKKNKANDFIQSLNKDNIKPYLEKCFNLYH